MSAKYKNQPWLREKYSEEKLTQSEIADRCGVAQPTISYYVEKFGIETPVRKPHHDEEGLQEKYVEERLSMSEIAGLCGVPRHAISKPTRRSSIESGGVAGDRNGMYGRRPTNASE